MLRRVAAFVLCWILLIPSSGFSWGSSGHRIVAKIAAKNLSPDVRKKVAAILGTSETGLEAAMTTAATWPDDGLDKQKTQTELWHFVDVPISGQFSTGHLCDAGNCVLNRIDEMSRRLQMNETNFKLAAPPTKPRPMTSQELAFLIHFVGDVHQPLHAANNGDRGGNCEPLKTPIVHAPFDTTELHAAWDDDEIRAMLKKESATEDTIASALFNRFKMGAQVPQLTPLDWARESNDLAKKDAYSRLMIPSHNAPPGTCDPTIKSTMENVNVTQKYLDGNVADVEVQLMRAGIRLSNVLNQICAGNGCKVVAPNNTGGGGGNKKKGLSDN